MSMALNGCWKKLWSEAVCDFQGFPEQQEEMKDFLVLASDVSSEEGFQLVEEGDIQEALESHDAEFTVEDLGRLTAVSGPENKEDPETVVERFHLTSSASKRGSQTADDLADHLLELDHFIERYLKFKQEVEAIKVHTGRRIMTCRRKQTYQKITCFFYVYSVSFPSCTVRLSITVETFARKPYVIPININTNIFMFIKN